MDAKGVRNMYRILVVFNKHNTTRVASCRFIIYYRIVMHGNSNVKLSLHISWRYSSTHSQLSTIEVSDNSRASVAITLGGGGPWYLLNGRLGRPQKQLECLEESKINCSHWNSNPGSPARCLDSTVTALYRSLRFQFWESKCEFYTAVVSFCMIRNNFALYR